MEFREAIRSDLDGILGLYSQLNPDDNPLSSDKASELWHNILNDSRCKYFVAVESEKIIASCTISIIPNLTRGGRCYGVIENVITDKLYRKMGIGKKVMQMVIDFAKEADCYKVILLSSMKRKEAHLFYEKVGFDGNSKRGFELRFR